MSDAENSAGSPGRVIGKPFQKGVSGNPAGRPKEYDNIKALARQHTEKAIMALVDALESKDRVSAAVALLDRAWGKPSQSVTGEGGEGPVSITYRWAKDDEA